MTHGRLSREAQLAAVTLDHVADVLDLEDMPNQARSCRNRADALREELRGPTE